MKKLILALILIKNGVVRADSGSFSDLMKEALLNSEPVALNQVDREELTKLLELYDSLDEEGKRKLFEEIVKDNLTSDNGTVLQSKICMVCTDGKPK